MGHQGDTGTQMWTTNIINPNHPEFEAHYVNDPNFDGSWAEGDFISISCDISVKVEMETDEMFDHRQSQEAKLARCKKFLFDPSTYIDFNTSFRT